MIPRRFLIFISLVSCIVSILSLQGCESATAKAAGTYELDKSAVKAAMEEEMKSSGDAGDQMGAAVIAGMLDAMSITLTLNEDGTASMSMNMMGDSEMATGTWSISGKEVTVSLAEKGEDPKPATGTLEGNTLRLSPPDGEDMPFDMVFTKKTAA